MGQHHSSSTPAKPRPEQVKADARVAAHGDTIASLDQLTYHERISLYRTDPDRYRALRDVHSWDTNQGGGQA